jgi:hypothetical protein
VSWGEIAGDIHLDGGLKAGLFGRDPTIIFSSPTTKRVSLHRCVGSIKVPSLPKRGAPTCKKEKV